MAPSAESAFETYVRAKLGEHDTAIAVLKAADYGDNIDKIRKEVADGRKEVANMHQVISTDNAKMRADIAALTASQWSTGKAVGVIITAMTTAGGAGGGLGAWFSQLLGG